MDVPKTTWIYAALAIAGLLLTALSVTRWAPDAQVHLADKQAVLDRAQADAEALGCQVSGAPEIQVAAGYRMASTADEVQALWQQVKGTADRRKLLAQVPPVRLGVRFAGAVGPEGNPGTLFLEYGPEGELVGTTFGLGDLSPVFGDTTFDLQYADFLAEALLGSTPPRPRTSQSPGQYELIYEPGEGKPPVYVFLGPGIWLAHLQPAPHSLVSGGSMNFFTWQPGRQLQLVVLIGVGLLALGLLLWRLPRQRAGFNQAHLVMTLLILGLVPVIKHYDSGDPRVLALLWCYLFLTQVGIWLGWAAAEAELREVRPRCLEPWDRILCGRPLARNGADLLRGLACGAALSGWLAASGAFAEWWGGGYRTFLVLLPDYWSLPTSINWGLALAVLTTLLVSFGGRLGGRPGAIVGALVSGVGWAQAIPVAPFRDALVFGTVAALAAGWLVWHRGLLTLAVTSVTALSLPTALVAWGMLPWLLEVAVISSLPALLFPAALALFAFGPRHGDARAVEPAYVSQLERQAKLQAEVDLLRELQFSLLPPGEPHMPSGVEVAWRMVPADLVGGDFFDLEEDAEGRLWLAMADVAGHGIACSVLTAYTKAAVVQHAVAGQGPAEAMGEIRRLFGRLRTQRTLVTMLLGVWDPRFRELTVTTAGHPPLLVWDGQNVREVGRPASPLGSSLGDVDQEQRIPCMEGSVLVAYTDGVAEALSPSGQPYSYERWPEILPELVTQPAEGILLGLLDDLERHRADQPAADDVTALVLKLTKC